MTEAQKALLALVTDTIKQDPTFAKALLAAIPAETQDEVLANLRNYTGQARDLLMKVPTDLLWKFGYNQTAARIEKLKGNPDVMGYFTMVAHRQCMMG